MTLGLAPGPTALHRVTPSGQGTIHRLVPYLSSAEALPINAAGSRSWSTGSTVSRPVGREVDLSPRALRWSARGGIPDGPDRGDLGQNGTVISAGGSLSGISKRFFRRGPWVLDGVDLTFQRGSRTVIVGGNGSGKSTLLRIVARVSMPTTGAVVMPRKMGYVPERLPDGIRLSGREYLTHMGRIRGIDSTILEQRGQELLERLDLQPGPDVAFDSLSKGNRQKLVIGQAFLEPVGMLVLDEPFGGLDSTANRALSELMGEAQSGGTSVVISSHHANARLGADRYLSIEGGQLHGTPSEQDQLPQVSDEQLIELTATANAEPVAQVAGLPGVRAAHAEALGLALSLAIERSHTDAFLIQAIRLGWSVSSVGAPRES